MTTLQLILWIEDIMLSTWKTDKPKKTDLIPYVEIKNRLKELDRIKKEKRT